MTDREITEWLRAGGYPEHVWKGGRQGLIDRWRQFVSDVEKGYECGLEDYRNELDVRALIAKLDLDAEVSSEDQRFQKLLTARDRRMWTSDPDGFWNLGYPANAGVTLLEDLRAEGLA